MSLRNRYPGPCVRCGERVEAGAGVLELLGPLGRELWHGECRAADVRDVMAGRRAPGARPLRAPRGRPATPRRDEQPAPEAGAPNREGQG